LCAGSSGLGKRAASRIRTLSPRRAVSRGAILCRWSTSGSGCTCCSGSVSLPTGSLKSIARRRRYRRSSEARPGSESPAKGWSATSIAGRSNPLPRLSSQALMWLHGEHGAIRRRRASRSVTPGKMLVSPLILSNKPGAQ